MFITTVSLPERILAHFKHLAEGTPLSAKALLGMGSRAAVDQALSRLTRGGVLSRVARGVYIRPRKTRFGLVHPETATLVQAWAAARAEIVVPAGASEANGLGLTRQVPIRSVYLTAGPNRTLQLGGQTVELQHAPGWKLALPGQRAGAALRAVEWLGERHAPEAVIKLRAALSGSERRALLGAIRGHMPAWLAASMAALAAS